MSGWKQLIRQVDRRTSSERRDYMQKYHARRRHDNGDDAGLPLVLVPAMPRCPTVPEGHATPVFYLRDETVVRRHLRDGSGRLMWPERSRQAGEGESLDETAKRCRRA